MSHLIRQDFFWSQCAAHCKLCSVSGAQWLPYMLASDFCIFAMHNIQPKENVITTNRSMRRAINGQNRKKERSSDHQQRRREAVIIITVKHAPYSSSGQSVSVDDGVHEQPVSSFTGLNLLQLFTFVFY